MTLLLFLMMWTGSLTASDGSETPCYLKTIPMADVAAPNVLEQVTGPFFLNRVPLWVEHVGYSGSMHKGADLDGDGATELLSLRFDDAWQVAGFDSQHQLYSHLGDHLNHGQIYDVVPIEASDTGMPSYVLTSGSDGVLKIHDGQSLALLAQLEPPDFLGRGDFTGGDLDGDGQLDLVLKTFSGVKVYSGVPPYELKWEPDTPMSNVVGLAALDQDPALEVVDQSGQVFDGATGQLEWTLPYQGFSEILLIDMDGQGLDELVQAHFFSGIQVYRMGTDEPMYDIDYEDYFRSIVAVDINGDGIREYIIKSFDHTLIIDSRTGEELGQITRGPTKGHDNLVRKGNEDFYRMVVGDFDGDGTEDLNTYYGFLNLQTQEPWSIKVASPDAMTLADLDSDGIQELVYASKNYSNPSPVTLVSLDPATGQRLAMQQGPVRDDRADVDDLQIADLDGDGRLEVVLLERLYLANYPMQVMILDAATLQEKRSVSISQDDTFFKQLRVEDIDGDGRLEIIAIKGAASQRDAKLLVLDAQTLVEEWSMTSTIGWANMALIQMDNDPALEIALQNNEFVVLDGASHQLETTIPESAGNFGFYDYNGDGRDEIWFAGAQFIKVYDTISGERLKRFDCTLVDYVKWFKVKDFNNDGRLDMFFLGSAEPPRVIDLETGALVWEGDFGTTPFFAQDLMISGDLNQNGLDDFVYNDRMGIKFWEPVFCQPMSLHQQSQAITQCEGENAQFMVTAEGQALSYQWYFEAQALTGQTDAVLNLPGVNGSDTGDYWCVIQDACGLELVTEPMTLTVFTQPNLLLEPVTTAACPGNAAVFTLTVEGVDLTYEWSLNGVVSPAFTGPELIVNPVMEDDGGEVVCRVFNSCGELTVSTQLIVSHCLLQEAYQTWRREDMAFCDRITPNMLDFVSSLNQGSGCP